MPQANVPVSGEDRGDGWGGEGEGRGGSVQPTAVQYRRVESYMEGFFAWVSPQRIKLE